MTKRMILLAGILGLLISVDGIAQGFRSGDSTFTLSGAGSSNRRWSNHIIAVEGAYGHFFDANLEGQIRQGLGISNVGDRGRWNAGTRVALDYHFGQGNVRPYLGGQFGFLYGPQVRDTFVAGPEGGVKWFVNDTTFINALVEYQFFFRSGNLDSDAFEDGRFVYTLGVGWRF